MLAALHGHVEGDLGDAAHLALGVLLDVVSSGAKVRVPVPLLAEVDAAGQLTHDHDVQSPGQDLRLQRGGVGQLLEQQGGTQVGEKAQGLPQAQQGAFGALVAGQVVPLPAAHGTQQHSVRGLADVDGLLGQAGAGGVDGAAAS